MSDGVKTNGFDKAKVQTFIAEWEKTEADASEKIGRIMAKVKSDKDNILEAAENIGIARKVMRSVINEKKLRNKADAARDAFVEMLGDTDTKEDMVDQRDNVALAAGLPLFDGEAEVDEPKPKKPKKGAKGTSPAKAAAKAAAGEEKTGEPAPMFEDGKEDGGEGKVLN